MPEKESQTKPLKEEKKTKTKDKKLAETKKTQQSEEKQEKQEKQDDDEEEEEDNEEVTTEKPEKAAAEDDDDDEVVTEKADLPQKEQTQVQEKEEITHLDSPIANDGDLDMLYGGTTTPEISATAAAAVPAKMESDKSGTKSESKEKDRKNSIAMAGSIIKGIFTKGLFCFFLFLFGFRFVFFSAVICKTVAHIRQKKHL